MKTIKRTLITLILVIMAMGVISITVSATPNFNSKNTLSLNKGKKKSAKLKGLSKKQKKKKWTFKSSDTSIVKVSRNGKYGYKLTANKKKDGYAIIKATQRKTSIYLLVKVGTGNSVSTNTRKWFFVGRVVQPDHIRHYWNLPNLDRGTGGSSREDSGISVLVFTSDLHNGPANTSRNRLSELIDRINLLSANGRIDYVGFCGDMGEVINVSESNYWKYTKAVIDLMAEKKIPVCYTTGNHEFDPGHLNTTTTNWVRGLFKIDEEAAKGKNYHIYCLGTHNLDNDGQKYYIDQVRKLGRYFETLDSAGDNLPVIILTHYPLHSFTYTDGFWHIISQTKNASLVIDALNKGANNGRDIVFLWGHNHVYADPHYSQILKPGSSLQYTESGAHKSINFIYAPVGCMCDQEYGSASGSVKGKAIILTIKTNNSIKNYALDFKYIDVNGEIN